MTDLADRLRTLRSSLEVQPFHIPLLDDARFTRDQAAVASFATPSQIHNWVSRGWLTLSGEQNPGRGKKRLYTGRDIIAIAVAVALQPFGMMQVADQLIRLQHVSNRAYFLLISPEISLGYGLGIVPSPDETDWLYIPFGADVPDQPEPPAYAVVAVDIDRLIIETLERLNLVAAGKPVPERSFPQKPTIEQSEDEYLEFIGKAYRDGAGNRIYRGLTLEESQELDRLINKRFSMHTNAGGPRLSEDERERLAELKEKNEIARLQYLGQRAQESGA